jgi:hypothetical protein
MKRHRSYRSNQPSFVAYDNNRMGYSRRAAFASFLVSAVAARVDAQTAGDQQSDDHHLPDIGGPEEDKKLPNGKSQKDAMAAQEHTEAMKEASRLVGLATDLKDELEKAGNFVVPLSTLHKTEEIEKLAKKIRGRLRT